MVIQSRHLVTASSYTNTHGAQFLWMLLPPHWGMQFPYIHNSTTIAQFKAQFKSHLFRGACFLCVSFLFYFCVFLACILFSFVVLYYALTKGTVDIQKGYTSEKFLLWRVIILKTFILKSCYCDKFYSTGSLSKIWNNDHWNFFFWIMTICNQMLWNNDL